MRESSLLHGCFTAGHLAASKSYPEMAEEASQAAPQWIRYSIQSVYYDHMCISPNSYIANHFPLCGSCLLIAN